MTLTPFGCFGYEYLNGSAAQHAQFKKVLDSSLFDFSRIMAQVQVQWVSDPSVHLHNEVAETHWDRPVSEASKVTMSILSQFRAQDDTEAFHLETIHHELGHVVQSRFSTALRDEMAALFVRDGRDGTPADWRAQDYDTGTNTWKNSIQEGFAETFKDIYLPADMRQYTNRTSWTLPNDRRESFFKVLDKICCPVVNT